MPTRKQKDMMIEELREKFNGSKIAVLADNKGINVSAMTSLRRRMREKGCDLKVVKNTLTIKVAKELGYEGLEEYLTGPTVIAFGGEDLVAPAKVMFSFIKETKSPMEVKAGVLEGRSINAKSVRELADLPPREVLLSKVLGGMQSPMYGFASVLQGTIRNFVYALEAVRQKKAEESA